MCVYKIVHIQFSCPSVHPCVCPWTQFCLELPLLNHFPFCDQNLLYDNALVGVWSRSVIALVDDGKPLRQKVQLNGISGSLANPGRAPILRTKSAIKNKWINAWQRYKIWTRFEPGTPGRKDNTITTELKRNLPSAVVRYCISIGKQPCLKECSSVKYLYGCISFLKVEVALVLILILRHLFEK